MTIYAVIDTNVLVSSLITKNDSSPTVAVIEYVIEGEIVPLYSTYLLNEYRNVLNRPKFNFPPHRVDQIIQTILEFGIWIEPAGSDIALPDLKDVPIYEITLDARYEDSYLVTGNTKHFPPVPFVVTPGQMVEIVLNSRQFLRLRLPPRVE